MHLNTVVHSYLVKSRQNIFTIREIQKIVEKHKYKASNKMIRLLVRTLELEGKIFKIKKDIYCLNKKYDIFELCNKIYKNYYVSLESIVGPTGMIKKKKTISLVSNISKTKKLLDYTIKFSKMSDRLLKSKEGIIRAKNGCPEATLERAVLDLYHLGYRYKVDPKKLNLINKNKLLRLAKIYNNKAMLARVQMFVDGLIYQEK